MYTSKQFRKKPFETIKSEIKVLAGYYQGVRKIFLADGNALVLSANNLIPVLEEINHQFGNVQRISSYALPSDIMSKSDEELNTLRKLGLKLLYIGVETGDDKLLRLINKSETYQTNVEGIVKAQNAGIETSVMILNGLGGKIYSEQHAIQSARLINEINPKFLSTLTLSQPFGQAHYKKRFLGEYQPQTLRELAIELKLFIQHLEINNTIFRSDHVSNNLVLKGVLSKDKNQMLHLLDKGIEEIKKDVFPTCHPFL
jgi:radical SAM superfamily enzyme YgiQ (UPF0313 family)